MPPRSRRPYGDAVAWIRSRVPSRRVRGAIAAGFLGALLVDALLLLSSIALVSPSSFGDAGARAFGSGTRTIALGAIAGAAGLWFLSRLRNHRRVVARIREPFRHPLEDDPAFGGAAGALEAAPGALQTRFAIGWIWIPALAVLGALAASLTTAYFLVDAVVARFEIGWQQPVFAAANLVVGWALLRAAAGRLAVWPLAVSVHREATTGYG
ncbi:MAG TPA: hypothetical protein VHN37_07610 [Actinomycetota bacterium]|nr:hypothetical protein [Actinomycetota bacterium]